MAYVYPVTDEGTQVGTWVLDTITYYCTEEEEYRSSAQATGSASWYKEYPEHTKVEYIISGIQAANPGARGCVYIYDQGYGTMLCNITDFGFLTTDHGNWEYTAPPFGAAGFPSGYQGMFSTNVPVFATQADASSYVNAATDEDAKNILKEKALNYFETVTNKPTTQDWYIYNTYDSANITKGIVTYSGGDPSGRYEIIKADKVVGYLVDPENSLEVRLIGSEIVGSVYSSVNAYDVQQKQHNPSAWTDGTIYYEGPFYKTLEYMPDGDYTIGVTMETNIQIFGSRDDAIGNLLGTVPDEEAINYGSTGDPEIASNETGQKETATTFGGNESENVFSHDYMMTRTQLATIGGKFFDTSIWQALLEGLKIYGNNPMDSVLGCVYFPFDLSTIATDATAVTDIYFGSYKMENVSANKIRHRSGYKEMGSTFITPTFHNWLDYKAQHVYLYLPYCGFVELDINKYLNKWLKVIYMVDIHSGECEISLLADGLLMDTYSGQIGIKQPITYNDLSTYFIAQVTALRNGAAALIGGPIAGAGTGAQMGANAGPYGAIAGAAAGATIGEIAGRATAMWTGYKVASTKPPLFSKGGYSSEIGANMPQYCFLVFMYNDVVIPENELTLYGKPSEKSGNVGSFSGFLSVNYVKLQVPTATETEKEEILSLLNSGIYI